MASVRGIFGMLQESLKPLQHGLLDPNAGYPIEQNIKHKYAILIFFLNIPLNQKTRLNNEKGSWMQKLNFLKPHSLMIKL